MQSPQTFDFQNETYDIHLGQAGIQGPAYSQQQSDMTMSHTPNALSQDGKEVIFDGQLLGHYVQDELGFLMAKCCSCRRSYRGKPTLIRHWRQMHDLQGGFCCRFCGKKFGQKSNFESHRNTCLDREINPQQPLSGMSVTSVQHTALETPQINTVPPFPQSDGTSSENRPEYIPESSSEAASNDPTAAKQTDWQHSPTF